VTFRPDPPITPLLHSVLATIGRDPVYTTDVIVPTYRRAAWLQQCLAALDVQTRTPNAVLVVVRVDDDETLDLVAGTSLLTSRLRMVPVSSPGVLAAMRAGVGASNADVLAFCDDDAIPGEGWLASLLEILSRPGVGAAGGRDLIYGQTEPLTTRVGVIDRWGRVIGNHHLGFGGPRCVDVLKGVNMAFRADALALPAAGSLRGSGAEVHYELMVCGWAARGGWKVVYDPAICVDHDAAPRLGADQRGKPARSAVRDAAYNHVVAVCSFGPRRVRKLAYALAVGTRDEPSFGRLLIALRHREGEVVRRAVPSLWGKVEGVRAIIRGRPQLLDVPTLRRQAAPPANKILDA